MNFEQYFESKEFNLKDYYSLLNSFLQSKKGWNLKEIPNDPYNQLEIVDKNGKRFGKIEREYNPKTKTLYLNHISVGFDDKGQRMKGLGLVDLIYNFDKKIVQSYDIKKVCTEAVNDITEKKFKDFYKDYKILQQGETLCAYIR